MSIPLCNVQHKIKCLFKTTVTDGSSEKRKDQAFKVIASDELIPEAEESLKSSVATEKLDGTSCFITKFRDQPWLWLRRDCKPTKSAEKKFRKFQSRTKSLDNMKIESTFKWNVLEDFKDVPSSWIPAAKVKRDSDGNLVPDVNGHIPGWMPVDPVNRMHCWHLTAVNYKQGCALVLRRFNRNELEITIQLLSELEGRTMELIGTHVNGNPYKIGSKKFPIHLLVEHGSITLSTCIPQSLSDLKTWFDTPEGQIEGIVWHCHNGEMYKIHRHHLNMKWPVAEPYLNKFPVTINVSDALVDPEYNEKNVFSQLSSLGRVTCCTLNDILCPLEATLDLDK